MRDFCEPSPGGDRETELLKPLPGGSWAGVNRASLIRPLTAKEYARSAEDSRPRPRTYYDGAPIDYQRAAAYRAAVERARPKRRSPRLKRAA